LNKEEEGKECLEEEDMAYDEVSGQALDASEVRKARTEETQFLKAPAADANSIFSAPSGGMVAKRSAPIRPW
jgi:hypothetical protein